MRTHGVERRSTRERFYGSGHTRAAGGGIVTEWVIATNSPNFGVVQDVLAIFVFVAVVGVVALWPRRAR
jgi:hypothetical protein